MATQTKKGSRASAGKLSPKKGRPLKTDIPALEKHGIVKSPEDSDNVLEFAYANPMTFKHLFKFFGDIKANEIFIRCTPTAMTFFTRNLTKNSRVVATFPGSKANWYYCDNEFWMGIVLSNFSRVFSRIDKSFYKISIRKRYNVDDRIEIVFKDAALDKDCNYSVSLSHLKSDDELLSTEKAVELEALSKYPLSFALTSAQIKKTVFDIAGIDGDVMTVEKIGGEYPLCIKYDRPGVTYVETYRAPEKIGLTSAIAEGKIFAIKTKIAELKTFVASTVTDGVKIFCKVDAVVLVFRAKGDDLEINTVVKVTE